MATSTSSARGCGTPAEWGGSSLVFDEVSAGPWGRAAVIDGPQLSPQHGIGAVRLPPVSGSGQHEEQRAPRGAAKKANASRMTGNRCTKRIFTDERSKACRSFPRIPKRWLTALPGACRSRRSTVRAPPFLSSNTPCLFGLLVESLIRHER